MVKLMKVLDGDCRYTIEKTENGQRQTVYRLFFEGDIIETCNSEDDAILAAIIHQDENSENPII